MVWFVVVLVAILVVGLIIRESNIMSIAGKKSAQSIISFDAGRKINSRVFESMRQILLEDDKRSLYGKRQRIADSEAASLHLWYLCSDINEVAISILGNDSDAVAKMEHNYDNDVHNYELLAGISIGFALAWTVVMCSAKKPTLDTLQISKFIKSLQLPKHIAAPIEHSFAYTVNQIMASMTAGGPGDAGMLMNALVEGLDVIEIDEKELDLLRMPTKKDYQWYGSGVPVPSVSLMPQIQFEGMMPGFFNLARSKHFLDTIHKYIMNL